MSSGKLWFRRLHDPPADRLSLRSFLFFRLVNGRFIFGQVFLAPRERTVCVRRIIIIFYLLLFSSCLLIWFPRAEHSILIFYYLGPDRYTSDVDFCTRWFSESIASLLLIPFPLRRAHMPTSSSGEGGIKLVKRSCIDLGVRLKQSKRNAEQEESKAKGKQEKSKAKCSSIAEIAHSAKIRNKDK